MDSDSLPDVPNDLLAAANELGMDDAESGVTRLFSAVWRDLTKMAGPTRIPGRVSAMWDAYQRGRSEYY